MIRDASNVQRVITGIKVRDAGNVLRTIHTVQARTTTALKLVFENFGDGSGVSVSPMSVYGSGYGSSAITISTPNVSVTVTGGTPPYTYAWSKTSGDSSWSIANPTMATTFFRRSVCGPGSDHTATFICIVTDANGIHSATGPISAEVENVYGV